MPEKLRLWDDEIPAVKYDGTMPVWIRFGRWSSRSKNHLTGAKEKGVSVYRAEMAGNSVCVKTEEVSPMLINQGRLVYPVTGQFCGTGSDGEPLLRRVRFVLGVAIDLASIPEWCRLQGVRND